MELFHFLRLLDSPPQKFLLTLVLKVIKSLVLFVQNQQLNLKEKNLVKKHEPEWQLVFYGLAVNCLEWENKEIFFKY